MKSRLFILLFALVLVFSGCKDEEEAGGTITSNTLGSFDGYDYEFWSNGKSTGKMVVGPQGTFTCNWKYGSDGGNILFRSGRRFGATRPHSQVGNITFIYSASYSPQGGASYLSIYGWTRNPLVEYYIVDNYYGGYHPGSQGSYKGTFTISGEGTYDIYTRQMYGQPSIDGDGKNFTQYISVRQGKRSSGTISVSEHFKKWHSLGMRMDGGLYEAMMKVEGYNSSGSAAITQNTLIIN